MNAFAALKATITGQLPQLPDYFCRTGEVHLDAVPHILIADDNKDYCDLVKAWLVKEGYAVESAYDIQTAKEKTDSKQFDLVILDLKFEWGEDGIDYLKWAHENHPDLTIIVCSGEPGYIANHVNDLVAIDAVTLLYKPLRRDQLLRVVNRFLGYGRVAR